MQKLYKKLGTGLVLGLALACANNVMALQVDYDASAGSTIRFNGDSTFSFAPGVNNIKVTSGAAAGQVGEITGTYTIGAGTPTAPVSGTRSFVIHDGSGFDLSGTLGWIDILQLGAIGGINYMGDVNLTGVTYGGTNPDLLALVGSDVNTLTFQFTSPLTLDQLRTTVQETSFSGSLSPVRTPDGGTTLMLLGVALSGVGFVRRKLAV